MYREKQDMEQSVLSVISGIHWGAPMDKGDKKSAVSHAQSYAY